LGEGRGIPKRHTLGTKHRNHNISPGRFWREKSYVSARLVSLLLMMHSNGLLIDDTRSLSAADSASVTFRHTVYNSLHTDIQT